jgi:vitamin B12 transporter
MPITLPTRLPGRLLLTCAVLAAPLGFIRAQAPVQSLDPFVFTATRTPLAPGAVGSAVDVITAEDLARRQVRSLSGALGLVPGAPQFTSGAPGGITSIFLRGANSNQTLFLVDGIRLNDPNTDYQLFLGGSCVSFCDSLEVSHGPQSTLYGGEAVGGVIALRARRGAGEPSGRVALEAGSFGTVQGALSAEGEHAGWGYVASLQGGHTDNERANNAFDSGNLTLRVDRTVREGLAVGATVRGFRGVYGSPGSRFTNDPDNEERERLGRQAHAWWTGPPLRGREPARGPRDCHHGGDQPSRCSRRAGIVHRPRAPPRDRGFHRRGQPHAQHRLWGDQSQAGPSRGLCAG